MTNRVSIRAVATDQARMVVIEAEGSGAGTEALLTAALAFVAGTRGPSVPPPVPAIAPPKKPRGRRT
ncbi:protein of unknown function [Methylorubrum extorquens DM4]|uniref:Uncharacterized protein n=1 Tax=Methylorubrum extorquens (strain DSM 6343 / CIP 106787 / DM4) TaxID=661410 RepID=C7CFD3_METED|nr:hypothetical protein [Methylorubrum extorquens]CAX26067.1 protein of unknown function [Methylorubrum extorquens DM4]